MRPLSIQFRKLEPNIRVILVPVILIVLFSFLAVTIAREGIVRINDQQSQIDKLKGDVTALENKSNILKEIDQNSDVLDSAHATLYALPESNASLLLISQLKKIGIDKNISITKFDGITTTKLTTGDIDKVTLFFEFEGDDVNSLIELAAKLRTLSPITTIEKLELGSAKSNNQKSVMSIEATVYWSKLPTQIGKLTEPVNELTVSDSELLKEIVALEKPQFETITASEPRDRENPFE